MEDHSRSTEKLKTTRTEWFNTPEKCVPITFSKFLSISKNINNDIINIERAFIRKIFDDMVEESMGRMKGLFKKQRQEKWETKHTRELNLVMDNLFNNGFDDNYMFYTENHKDAIASRFRGDIKALELGENQYNPSLIQGVKLDLQALDYLFRRGMRRFTKIVGYSIPFANILVMLKDMFFSTRYIRSLRQKIEKYQHSILEKGLAKYPYLSFRIVDRGEKTIKVEYRYNQVILGKGNDADIKNKSEEIKKRWTKMNRASLKSQLLFTNDSQLT